MRLFISFFLGVLEAMREIAVLVLGLALYYLACHPTIQKLTEPSVNTARSEVSALFPQSGGTTPLPLSLAKAQESMKLSAGSLLLVPPARCLTGSSSLPE